MILQKKHTFLPKLKKGIFISSFLAISLVHFAIFWVYINFDTVRLTFYSFNAAKQEYFWNNFENYKRIWQNIVLGESLESVRAFWNTFRSLLINFIILPLAMLVAYAFYKKVPGTNAFRIIFYLPSIVSIVILAMAYRAMFRADTGPIYLIFEKLGYTTDWLAADETSKTIWPCIYVFAILNGMSTNVILLNNAMLRIPTEVSEAAKMDGCGFFREFFTITIPLIMPTITTWVTQIFVGCFGFYMAPMLIGGAPVNGKTMTIPWEIFNAVSAGSANVGNLIGAAATGIFLSIVVLPFTLITRFIMKKITPEVSY